MSFTNGNRHNSYRLSLGENQHVSVMSNGAVKPSSDSEDYRYRENRKKSSRNI